MTVRNTAQHPAVLILLISFLLSGCGGGGGSSIAGNNAASQDNDSTNSGGNGGGVDSGNIPTSSCQLTPSEVNMLEQINQICSQARACGSTHYSATEPLNWDCKLQEFATPTSVNATFYSIGLVESQSALSGADLYRSPEEQ
jgi:hypothetical protein